MIRDNRAAWRLRRSRVQARRDKDIAKPSRQRIYHRCRVLVRNRNMAKGRFGFTVHGARLAPTT